MNLVKYQNVMKTYERERERERERDLTETSIWRRSLMMGLF